MLTAESGELIVPNGPDGPSRTGGGGDDGTGSNNWVAGPSITTTGKPALASDPHWPVSFPRHVVRAAPVRPPASIASARRTRAWLPSYSGAPAAPRGEGRTTSPRHAICTTRRNSAWRPGNVPGRRWVGAIRNPPRANRRARRRSGRVRGAPNAARPGGKRIHPGRRSRGRRTDHSQVGRARGDWRRAGIDVAQSR